MRYSSAFRLSISCNVYIRPLNYLHSSLKTGYVLNKQARVGRGEGGGGVLVVVGILILSRQINHRSRLGEIYHRAKGLNSFVKPSRCKLPSDDEQHLISVHLLILLFCWQCASLDL